MNNPVADALPVFAVKKYTFRSFAIRSTAFFYHFVVLALRDKRHEHLLAIILQLVYRFLYVH